jgi:thioester reductase-like protein
MSSRKNVLVTGATGFVGCHLAWKLLENGCTVTAIARGSRNSSARDRVVEVLQRAAWPPERWQDCADRLQVIEGDIGKPRLGLSTADWNRAANTTDEIWHCAASLAFAEEERDEIFRMNVGGTRELLELASQTPSRRFHHVSTAYVAGIKEVALESEIQTGQRFRNPYEASKCEAELAVAEANCTGAAIATVYRPSVVIGDSVTGRATHFHGVYAFFRGLFTASARLKRGKPPGTLVHLPLRVVGRLDTTLNFVPIDYVVNGMLHIGNLTESVGGTYHLANPEATPNSLWLPHTCRLLEISGVRFVDASDFEATPPSKLEGLFQKQMAFYYMYLQGEPRFDCSRALAALKGSGIECPSVTVDFIEKIVGWYIRYLKTT